jgi:hypothetical protein
LAMLFIDKKQSRTERQLVFLGVKINRKSPG